MPFDPSRIPRRTRTRTREINPESIFESLTLRGTIDNLWSPQAAALKEWHSKRAASDIVVEMNTGGGKTLVGMLIAQSLVNETAAYVLYVCPTNQLVEQATEKAAACGMEVATYMAGNWVNKDIADDCRGPCITNYAAVFNGKTIFDRYNLGAIVFDDAHVAGNIIRSQFTLTYRRDHPLFGMIINHFRAYFGRASLAQRLQDAFDGDPRAVLFVPMFEVRRAAAELVRLMMDHGVAEDRDTLFAWEHLKDHIGRCVVVISGSRIEITPSALPIHRLHALRNEVRRVYMTATLPSPVEFVKTFGITEPTRIVPGGKSGEAQRLFVFPSGADDDVQQKNASSLVRTRKACIIVPTTASAGHWLDVAELYAGETGQAGIQRFATAERNEKLVLVARYDGIDLPGDACRTLVLDGLPKGSNLLDRFIDESLQVVALRASHTAIRMIQAIGRIFRSNTDHGAVVLCGTELQRWARNPSNLTYLPPLLQKQIHLGLTLYDSVQAEETNYEDLLTAVQTGARKWDEFYQERIDDFDTSALPSAPEWLVDVVACEQKAYRRLWEGDAANAAAEFGRLAEDSAKHNKQLSAWFRHWEGVSFEFAGSVSQALRAYSHAANAQSVLGRPKTDDLERIVSSNIGRPSPQAEAIAEVFHREGARIVRSLDDALSRLQYGRVTNPVEQATCDLGRWLGFEATRPDNSEGTGPDVLWRYSTKLEGVALEAKTGKSEASQYKKRDDIGQLHDHEKYLEQKYPDYSFRKVIVGRVLRVSSECHPPDGLRIIPLEQIIDLAKRTQELYKRLIECSTVEGVPIAAEKWLQGLGLKWPSCVDSLQSNLAVDLQSEGEDSPLNT